MLEQVRAAVAAPLVLVVCVLGGVVIIWQTVHVPTGLVLAVLAGGLLGAAGLGAVRARAAAVAVERAHEAQLQRVTEAVSAVEKLVVWSAEELCRGGTPALPESLPPLEGAGPADEAVALLGEVQVQAVASLIRVRDESKSAVELSMLHQFSKREHALIDRALQMLDRLQDLTEDPDQLDTIYKLDHLVTRMRRWVESKAVACGGKSLRTAREPVNVTQVLRGAVQEIMHYARVTVTPGEVGVELGLPRQVGPDLTHLLAELIENGTQYSDPASKVQVRAQRVARGLLVEVEDRAAIPMRPNDRARWNRLLANPDQVDKSALASEGRLGLLTTALLARKYGISVELRENPTGGTTALVVVPDRLLVAMPVPAAAVTPQAAPHAPVPTPSALVYGQQAAPTQPQTASPTVAGQATGAPPLPQRVVGDSPQRPTRPERAATAPRYGLAGAFQQNLKAARTRDRAAPAAQPDASGPPVPPSAHP
ncbi:ATP-binding protein [Streptomyces collinus]|uniref:ATP-binding protein n=1 Tax=Streptomyces collinus TaxID=42684 RepID=UPI00367E5035